MTRGRKSLAMLTVLFLFCLMASEAVALQFSAAKVVDLQTPIPGGTGDFTFFFAGDIVGNTVPFNGQGVGQQGIYLFNGSSLTVLANLITPIPGGLGNFTAFWRSGH